MFKGKKQMLPASLTVARIEVISRFFLSLFVVFIEFGKIFVETFTFY